MDVQRALAVRNFSTEQLAFLTIGNARHRQHSLRTKRLVVSYSLLPSFSRHYVELHVHAFMLLAANHGTNSLVLAWLDRRSKQELLFARLE